MTEPPGPGTVTEHVAMYGESGKAPTPVFVRAAGALLCAGCSLTDLSGLQAGRAGTPNTDAGLSAGGANGDASVDVGGAANLVDAGTGGTTPTAGAFTGGGTGAVAGSGTEADASLGGAAPDAGPGPGEVPVEVPAMCGDGDQEGTEACDTDGESADCNANCTLPACGDRIVNGAAGEECDEGGLTSGCTPDCKEFACPTGCSCEARLGHFYVYCEDPINAAGVDQRCDALDMHSVIIDDAAEDFFVRTLANTSNAFFIGAGDGTADADEGLWRWSDRRRFWTGAAGGQPESGAYANWAAGEPNDFNLMEDCAEYLGAAWNDTQCADELASVCELTPEFSSLCGDGSLDFGEACDESEETTDCDEDCSVPACGDGLLNEAALEVCDDGNDVATDACDACEPTGLLALLVADEVNRPAARSHVSEVSLGRAALFALDGNGLVSAGQYAEIFGSANALARLDVDGDITIALEVRFATTPAAEALLVGHGDGTDGVSLRVSGAMLSGGSADGGTSVLATATPNWFDAAWHHVALTYDGTSWQLYVDGDAAGDAVESDQGAVPNSNRWTVFGTNANTELVPNDTSVRQLRIYDRGLSADEIAAIAAL